MTTIAAIRDSIRDMLEDLPSGTLKRVFVTVPQSIQRAELPLAIINVGAATYDATSMSEQIMVVRRQFTIEVHAHDANLGVTGTTAETTAETLLATLRDFLYGRVGIENTDDTDVVWRMRLTGDSGLELLRYGDTNTNIGFRLFLLVETLQEISYGLT